MDLQDPSVRADDVRDSGGDSRGRRVARAVGHPDLPLRVAEEREGVVEFLCEGGVLLDGVERGAEDLDVLLLELAVKVAEPATLDRSTGRVGLRIEPEDDGAAPVVGELSRRTRLVRNG